jgi:hypothetical protein
MYGNAKYDASEKAFRLDGTSGTYMSGTQNLGTGTPAHTITGWFKQVVSLNNWTYVMFIGTSGNGTQSGMLISNTGQIVFDIYNTRIDTTVDASTGIWHHFAGVFKGGTSVWDNASTDLYINGKLEGSAAPDSGTQYPFNLTGNGIQFGSATAFLRYFNGFISQFKLYDTALTASEVKTLYDMGRCSNAIPKTLHIMGGMMRYNNDIGKLQIHNGAQWSTIGGITATGGTITQVNGYRLHTFTSSGTFTLINTGGYVDILIVGGGGAGGGVSNGGGGGAGGIKFAQNFPLTPGTYTIVVGAGGAANGSANLPGASGSNSSFSLPTNTGHGGGGGGEYGVAATAGGSGGGAGAYAGSQSGGTANQGTNSTFTGYGNNGGNSSGTSASRAGGGGGGAGGAGGANNGVVPGQGGDGINLSATFGTDVGESGHFASGGHGQSRQATGVVYNGPLGGGGGNNGVRSGLANTGGGGHGGSGNSGGSGIVIIRYLI